MTDPFPSSTIRYDTGMAVMWIADAHAPDRLGMAVAALGGRVVERLGWHAPLGPRGPLQAVALEAAGVASDLLCDRLPAFVAWARANDAALVVALALDQIDLVAAATLGDGATLLVDASVAECVAALALAAERSRMPQGVSDVAGEGAAARLERLHTEIARIAEALARLTRAEEREALSSGTVGDRGLAYGAPPAGSAPEPSAAEVRRAIRGRRLRDQVFGTGYFEDPGWDMLLDLFAAELEHVQVSVSSLCIAAAVAPTTALRWIGRMTDAGLLERHPDPHDKRRAFMALSVRAGEMMRSYIRATRHAGVGIA